MNIDKRLFVLIVVAATAAYGAAAAWSARLRQQRIALALEHRQDVKSWENEGGNLAPAAVSPAQP